jgi:hypothetical protein
MTTANKQNPAQQYRCESCDYITSKKCNYEQHLLTRKHTMTTSGLHKLATAIVCDCGKTFSCRQNIYRHKKKCLLINQPYEPSPTPTLSSVIPSHSSSEDMKMTLILELVKQHQDFKDLMIEQSKQITELMKLNGNTTNNTINNISNSNNNNNNKTFNLQFFLNETCKNAMNLSDFIETIDVQMNELENIGHNGYVAGMTDIILSRIKDLDVSKRPVHCTDLKRETMYIKDQDEWNKDTTEKSYLRKAISMVSKKNYGKTMEWRERNPECLEIGSQKYDFCFKMMRNVLGDFEDIQIKMDNKIIKNLAKEVVVDR